jgi:hypothetical protein
VSGLDQVARRRSAERDRAAKQAKLQARPSVGGVGSSPDGDRRETGDATGRQQLPRQTRLGRAVAGQGASERCGPLDDRDVSRTSPVVNGDRRPIGTDLAASRATARRPGKPEGCNHDRDESEGAAPGQHCCDTSGTVAYRPQVCARSLPLSARVRQPTSACAREPSLSRAGLKIVTSMPTARSELIAIWTSVCSSSQLRPPGKR